MISRQGQRAQLAELLDRALAGRGGTAMLLGDAGIGKSALARALAGDAADAGFTVVVGGAWEFADAPPYFPLWPCLRSLGLEIPAQGAEGNVLETAFRFWERVVEALARHSAARPVVWILDDLHAADQQTLELCCFLAEPLHALRALVVGTSRLRDPRYDPSGNLRLERLRRTAVEIVLEPLAGAEVAALAEHHTGKPVTAETRRHLVELTGGNPLFVVECARALRLSGAARLFTLPPSIRLLALEQVGQLATETRAAVEAGAVIGRTFSAAIVARMQGVAPARVVDQLAPAVHAGLLDELGPGDFGFNHVILRDAVYEAISAERRAEAHQCAERVLLEADPEGTLVERAHHALSSIHHGNAPQVLQLADEASRRLEAQGAFDRALALAERAIQVQRLRRGPVSLEAVIRAASLAFSAGAFGDGRRWCDEAMAQARSAGRPIELARTALLLGATLRPGNRDEELVRALQEALATVPASEPGLRLRLRARLTAAVMHAAAPEPLALVAEARRIVAEAHAHGDDDLLVHVLVFAGSVTLVATPVEEGITHARALRDLALRLGDRPRALTGYHRLVIDQLQAGHLDDFARDADELFALARELGHPHHQWRALLVQSMRALARGRFVESERFLVEVEHLAALTDDPALGDSLRAHRFMRLRAMHRDADVRTADPWPQADKHPKVAFAMRVGHAAFYEQRDEAERLMADARAARLFDAFVPQSWTVVAEAVAFVGSEQERRRFLELLLPRSDGHGVSGHGSLTYEGPCARVIGLLQASLGERAAAEASLRRALAMATQHDFRPWVARISYELGQLLGTGDERAGHLAEAARLADELDLAWLRARLSRLFVAAPVEARVIAPVPRLAIERKAELWELTVDGRVVHMRNSRGMQLLARLIEQPGEELHVLGLASDEADELADSDAGEVIDAQAARAYRDRMALLREELAASERLADGSRLERLRREYAVLERELAAAVGLSGKLRRAGSVSERARVNVQRRLRDAIRRIAEADPALGRYLERAVRTGTYCCYRP